MSIQHIGYKKGASEEEIKKEAQLDGIHLDKEYIEIEGKEKLWECLCYLRAGDTLHFQDIGILANSTSEFEEIIIRLMSKNITVKFHKEDLTLPGEDELVLQALEVFSVAEKALRTSIKKLVNSKNTPIL